MKTINDQINVFSDDETVKKVIESDKWDLYCGRNNGSKKKEICSSNCGKKLDLLVKLIKQLK